MWVVAWFFSKKTSKNDLLNIIKEVYGKKIEINPDNSIRSDKTLSTKRPDMNYIVQSHREMLAELKNITFKKKCGWQLSLG